MDIFCFPRQNKTLRTIGHPYWNEGNRATEPGSAYWVGYLPAEAKPPWGRSSWLPQLQVNCIHLPTTSLQRHYVIMSLTTVSYKSQDSLL